MFGVSCFTMKSVSLSSDRGNEVCEMKLGKLLLRFRQAICGYSGVRVKVCCDVGSNSVNPVFTQDDALSKSDLFLECGKSFIPSDSNTVGAYPFVARIGFRSESLVTLC